jgi:prepilin-type N-terminal cleavage/methylation domain-containing protein
MKKNGFTLIELMIIVAIVAIIAAVTIPNLLAARLRANEASAVSTLRSLETSQRQFQASMRANVDKDEMGEFGLFRELSGAAAIRTVEDGTGGTTVLKPPVLIGAFRTINGKCEFGRSGYLFQVFLPGAGGEGVGEKAGTTLLTSLVDTDLAEKTWCAYAWPASYGNSGNQTFFVSQERQGITCTNFAKYSATGAFSTSNAGRAFLPAGPLASITGRQAVGTRARDGQLWKLVQ